MFTVSTALLTAYRKLVGFKQNTDATGWQITAADDLLAAESGLFYTNTHPLVTFENLVAVSERFDQTTANDTDRDTAFTTWLTEHVDSSITTALNTWIDHKIGRSSAANLLADARLFNGTGSIENLTDPDVGNFQCIEIIPFTSKHIKGKIKRIGLHFTEARDIAIQLFSQSKATRVIEQVVNHTGDGVEWFDLTDFNLEGGQTYYIGYHGSKMLTTDSINGVVRFNWASRGLTWFPTQKQYQATAMEVETADDGNFWDVRKNSYTVSDNFGINLELDFRCDYEQFFIDNKLMFAPYLRYHVAIDLIRLMIANPTFKINRLEANVGNLQAWLSNEIVGHKDEKRDGSLVGKWVHALKAIEFERGSIDETCLPCNQQKASFQALGGKLTNYSTYY